MNNFNIENKSQREKTRDAKKNNSKNFLAESLGYYFVATLIGFALSIACFHFAPIIATWIANRLFF